MRKRISLYIHRSIYIGILRKTELGVRTCGVSLDLAHTAKGDDTKTATKYKYWGRGIPEPITTTSLPSAILSTTWYLVKTLFHSVIPVSVVCVGVLLGMWRS